MKKKWGVAKRNRRLETGSGTHPSQDWTVSSPHLDEDQASESSSASAPVDRRHQNRATSGILQPSVAVLQSVRDATLLNCPPRPHRPCRSVQPAVGLGPEWGRPPPLSPPLCLQAAMGEATGGRWRNRATRLAMPGRQSPTKDTALALQTWTTTGEPPPQDCPRTTRPTQAPRRETGRGSGGTTH